MHNRRLGRITRTGAPLVLFIAAAAAFLAAVSLRAADTPTTAPIEKGQRVFSAGHSFHMFVPGILREIALSAGIKDHVQVGTQGIGGSRVIQHWDLAEEKNKIKPALIEGKTDVLTLSPIFLPDDGIEKLVDLGLKHNPNIRVFVQAFWLPYDVYLPEYQKKRPEKPDRNAKTIAELTKAHEPYFASMEKLTAELNARHGKPVLFVVPTGQAVLGLREKVVAGAAPGVKSQEDLFTDAIGHVKAPVQVLNAYCHFAAIYRRSPVGLPTPAALKKSGTAEEVEKLNRLLQELAWDAVSKYPPAGAK